MKIYVIDPDGVEDVFDDTDEGHGEAIEKVLYLIRNDGYLEEDITIIRGEKLTYVPPTSNGQLIKA